MNVQQGSSAHSRKTSHMSSSAPLLSKPTRKPMSLTQTSTRPREGVRSTDGGWDTSPHVARKEYSSENDPHCPRAVVRKYNKIKKQNAIERSKKGQGASDWIENTIKKKFEDIPIREKPTLREKAVELAAVEKESVPEVDILQSIIIRENLIKELDNLLRYQTDIDSVLNEAVELVKAIRFQTLQIVEIIYAWKSKQKVPTRQFFYRGTNYLLKMMEDTAFLDNYDELGEYFGFYFSGNPLLYSGVPENEMPSLLNESAAKQSLVNPSAVDRNVVLIDGLSESRLRAAENIVFREYSMIKEGEGEGDDNKYGTFDNPGGQQSSLAIGEGNMYESMVGDTYVQTGMSSVAEGHNSQDQQQSFHERKQSLSASMDSADHSKRAKKNQKVSSNVSTRSQKKRRIKKLKEEIEELQAMRSHVSDQIDSLIEEHGAFTAQHITLERKKNDALSLENMALAKRLAIECSALEDEMNNRASEVKSHQRQGYFLQQEITRRKGLIKVMQAELDEMDSKAGVKKKLMKIQKKDGLYAALIKVNSVVEEHEAEEMKAKEEKSDPEPVEESNVDDEVKEEEEQRNDEMDEEPPLWAGNSVFSNMEQGSSLLEEETGIESQDDSKLMNEMENADTRPPEELLAKLPVVNADRVIDDVNALANSMANTAVSSSLEMMWFVMGAAEEVRPLKIVTRNYAKYCLAFGTARIACSRVTARSTVVDCVLEGFKDAAVRRVKQDLVDARVNFIADFVTSSFTTALNMAVNIISHEATAKKDRAIQRVKVLSNETASHFVEGVFNTVLTAVTVKAELERLEELRIEHEKRKRVVQEVADVCDEFTFGSIGAALYTIENKVMRYKNAMDYARENSSYPDSVGVLVHPAGAGFALAKMVKQQNRAIQLEMYDIDAKTGVHHAFPSLTRSHDDPNVRDLIKEALENTGDDYGTVMYGKKLGIIHQTEVEYEDWTFDVQLVQDIDEIKLVAVCSIPGLEKKVSFVLSKEQEEDLDNTRNPINFMKYILTSALEE